MHPGLTEPTLALARQASALFSPRTMTDSPALQPLHSADATRFAGCADAIASFRRPQTVETVKSIRARPQNGTRAEGDITQPETADSREPEQLSFASQAPLPKLPGLPAKTKLV
jgi:hypothetical protein